MEVMAQNMALHTVMGMGMGTAMDTAMGMEMGMDILPMDIMKRKINPIKKAFLVG